MSEATVAQPLLCAVARRFAAMNPGSQIGETLSMYRTALASAAPLILAFLGPAHAADGPTSPAEGPTAVAAVAADVPVAHGFLIRLPICSWKALPTPEASANPFQCVTYRTPRLCTLGANGEPVAPDPSLEQAAYFIKVPRIVEYSDGNAIAGFRNAAAEGELREMKCRYDGRLADSYYRWGNPSPYGGAQINLTDVPFETPARRATAEERQAGLAVARVSGFVNGDVLRPEASYEVRGTVHIGTSDKATHPTWRVQLVLQTHEAPGYWADVEQSTYTPRGGLEVLEVSSLVPANTDVRFEVRLATTDGKGMDASLLDVRLYGSQCYADVNNPGMCL